MIITRTKIILKNRPKVLDEDSVSVWDESDELFKKMVDSSTTGLTSVTDESVFWEKTLVNNNTRVNNAIIFLDFFVKSPHPKFLLM